MDPGLTLTALSLSAVSLGFLHTLLGPDHYVPFIAMSQAGRWSLRKTTVITVLCGIGHVGSSVLLGFLGIGCGLLVERLETVEATRGEWAGWLLIAFGFTYFVWGLVRAFRKTPHTHWHAHRDGTIHTHEHPHQGEHLHAHAPAAVPAENAASTPVAVGMTPWILFTIFLFGPCEPLIPLLMYPAAQSNFVAAGIVALLFGLVTLFTMTSIVIAMWYGVHAASQTQRVTCSTLLDALLQRLRDSQHFGHAAAGLVVLSCGLAVKLGL